MASDRERFSRAVGKWNELRASRTLSLPESQGRAAIFVTNTGYGESSDNQAKTLRFMRREARNYAKVLKDFYKATDLYTEITRESLRDVVQDPHVSAIVLVGEGGFSSLFDDHVGSASMWWHDVSEWTTHLKQGVFYQRFCGHYPNDGAPVPFGAFAMTSLTQVYAVKGMALLPEEDAHIEESFAPVSCEDMLTYAQMRASFCDRAPAKPTLPAYLLPMALAVAGFVNPETAQARVR